MQILCGKKKIGELSVHSYIAFFFTHPRFRVKLSEVDFPKTSQLAKAFLKGDRARLAYAIPLDYVPMQS